MEDSPQELVCIDFGTLRRIDEIGLLFEDGGTNFDWVLERETASIAFEKDKDCHEEVKHFLRDFEFEMIDSVEYFNHKSNRHSRSSNNNGLKQFSKVGINAEYLKYFAHIRNISNSHISHQIS